MEGLINCLMFFVVAILVVGMLILYIPGIRKLLEMRQLKRRCICKVDAEVIDIIATEKEIRNRGTRYITIYSPEYRFCYKNEEYKVIEKVKTDYCQLCEGDMVELFIDPENPWKFYCPQVNGRIGAGIALIVMGAIVTMFTLSIVCSFILFDF